MNKYCECARLVGEAKSPYKYRKMIRLKGINLFTGFNGHIVESN